MLQRGKGTLDAGTTRSFGQPVVASAGLDPPVLDRWERATGLALGTDPPVDPPLEISHNDPRAALVSELTDALLRSPCVVSFSGGRDSSAVLALATLVARREGLPEPVPVSLRFPSIASTEESRWQELVVGHLRLREWERITLDEELDLLGPLARTVLERHGLLWPANAHLHVPIFERARDGCVLTGFDGDGLLGGWRWARAQAVLHGQARPHGRDLLRVALALAPPPARRRWMRPPVLAAAPWIRPEAGGELLAQVRADAAREPRRWDRRIFYYTRRRQVRLTVHSLRLLGAERAVQVRHPLLAPSFLTALAGHGGAAGYGDRTSAMRILFGDLVPAQLVARRTKAEFGRALWQQETHAFAAGWDGSGLDEELVDPELVREAWRGPSPPFGAHMLLQQAWLATQRT